MESKVKFLGHPIHMVLITLPLGVFAIAVIFDLIYLISDESEWAVTSFRMIVAGLIAGLVAAVFGYLDWQAVPSDTRAKRVGFTHGALNVVMIGLFFISCLIRASDPGEPESAAFLFAFAGAGVLAISGWLGGELTTRMRVGIDDNAHLNAPNSLTGDSGYTAQQPRNY
jgi:uncharacterized membrane protein